MNGQIIALRSIEKRDKEILFQWVNDSEIIQYTNYFKPVSEIEHEAWFSSIPDRKDESLFGIELKKEKKLIGTCGLFDVDRISRKAEFRIKIGDKQEWGKGYGTEAAKLLLSFGFSNLNLHRIWLKVHDDNIGAIKSYEKVGFVKEGLLKEDMFIEGKYKDLFIMGLLKDED